MKSFLLFISIVTCINCSNSSNSRNPALFFTVQKIGELPYLQSNQKNKGVAGAFAGIVHNRLIVAGGCYFPDKKPWEGGSRIYGEKIYAFGIGKDTVTTIPLSSSLHEPVAYGASVTLPEGILCIGGNNQNRCTSKVFLIKWDEASSNVFMEDYPDLPVPISLATAILLNNYVYVAGGSSFPDGKETNNFFYRLDVSKINRQSAKWEILPPYPGIPRILSVAAVQSNGVRKCLYLFSGRNVTNPDQPIVMNDGWMFDPEIQKWDPVKSDSKEGFPVMAGSAFPDGSNDIVLIGGAPDSTFLKGQQLSIALGKASSGSSADLIKAELIRFNNNHQGFSTQIRVYNTVNKHISSGGRFPELCPVTTCAISFGDGAIVACGEIKPGVRTPDIFKVTKKDSQNQ